ncbi:histone-lysine N-methyltransferase SETMAR [Trichonephila clavipes]|nr:histone-lysine N-methyltransferase SETMAR [Trichonephila clavipes]
MQEETTDRQGQSYPPHSTPASDERRIVCLAMMDHAVTLITIAQQIQSVTHHLASTRNIRSRLEQSEMSTRHPVLRLGNRRFLRRQWCDERRIRTIEWNDIVFTDKSRFCMQHMMIGIEFRDNVAAPASLVGIGNENTDARFKRKALPPYSGKNASQVAEIVYIVYGINTITTSDVQFWFRRFRSGIFDVKDAPRTGRPTFENVDKIIKIIEVDRHVSSRSITQELKIDHKTVLNHLRKVGFKKKLDLSATPINTKKHDGSNSHLRSLHQTE